MDKEEIIINWFKERFAGDIDVNEWSEKAINELLKNTDKYIESEKKVHAIRFLTFVDKNRKRLLKEKCDKFKNKREKAKAFGLNELELYDKFLNNE